MRPVSFEWRSLRRSLWAGRSESQPVRFVSLAFLTSPIFGLNATSVSSSHLNEESFAKSCKLALTNACWSSLMRIMLSSSLSLSRCVLSSELCNATTFEDFASSSV